MNNRKNLVIAILMCSSLVAQAADELEAFDKPQAKTTKAAIVEPKDAFSSASDSMHQKLEKSLAELSGLRKQVTAELTPLNQKLRGLENKLINARSEYQQASRQLDSSTLDLSNLRNEIKSRKEESIYLSNLLGEYIRNFESRLHISETQRYDDILESAKLAPENKNLSEQEVYQTQIKLLDASLDRLEDALGGTTFNGSAVDATGLVKKGKFVLVGPTCIFKAEDGGSIGTVEQRLGSLEPTVIPFGTPEDTAVAASVIDSLGGNYPLDPTRGNAHKIESTKQSLWEHISKGGPVMIPILGMAGIALLVAIYKWFSMAFTPMPSKKQIVALLKAVADKNAKDAMVKATAIKGPAGKMLVAGVEHLAEPRELIEEVMYETVLSTRLKLQKLLPFIAICAASAPLLGLLGTVTGIINTFKLITVFGSGDVKMLSGGISEALITTEFGLIVAIPSLLLHAFLSRKAKSVTDQMERAAVSFTNQVSKSGNDASISFYEDFENEMDEDASPSGKADSKMQPVTV